MNHDEPIAPAAQAAKTPAERRTVEAWAAARATPKWLLEATRAGQRWPIGQELTAEAFDRAVAATANEGIR